MKYSFENNSIRIPTENTRFARMSVELFLESYHLSRKSRYLCIQNRMLFLNDVPVKSGMEKIEGKELRILLPPEPVDWSPAEKECEVIYEDPFVCIVHKEPGIIIHTDQKTGTDCLNAFVARYQINHEIHAPVRPIHRLDKETAGLVLYAKIPFFQPWFDEQLKEKKIARQYLAIVHGTLKPGDSFVSSKKIGRDRHHAGMYRVSSRGKDACTKFVCLEQKGPYSLIRCDLETGRTHQIRVHLSDLGYPIVNDALYGVVSHDFRHMGLWADTITFRNPVSGKKHTIHDRANPDYAYFDTERKRTE